MNPIWQQIADRAHLTLSAHQLDQLSRYIDLLLIANTKMNLTRIDTRESAETGHVADTLTLLEYLPAGPHRLADVGSGAGLPGMVLAIARPDSTVTLIESTQKKAAFLQETATELGLQNIKVIASRAEDEARGHARERFEVVTARALAAMNALAEWCLPLTKVGGKVLAMKGGKIAEELPAAANAIKLLGGGDPIVHPAGLPGMEHHVIVEIKKIKRTENRYPRTPGIMKEKPL